VGDDLRETEREDPTMNVWIAALTGTMIVAPAPVSEVEPSTSAVEVQASLEIDASALGEAGPAVWARAKEKGDAIFSASGIAPADSEDDPRVHVTAREAVGDTPGFVIEIAIANDVEWTAECSLCTETELVEQIGHALEKAVVALHERGSTPAAGPQPSVPATPVRSPTDDARPSHRPLRPMAKAGIGTLAAGVAVMIVGAGLAAAPPKPLEDDPTQERYTQPPGYALLGVGSAAIVTGVVLIVLGTRKPAAVSRRVSASGLRF